MSKQEIKQRAAEIEAAAEKKIKEHIKGLTAEAKKTSGRLLTQEEEAIFSESFRLGFTDGYMEAQTYFISCLLP